MNRSIQSHRFVSSGSRNVGSSTIEAVGNVAFNVEKNCSQLFASKNFRQRNKKKSGKYFISIERISELSSFNSICPRTNIKINHFLFNSLIYHWLCYKQSQNLIDFGSVSWRWILDIVSITNVRVNILNEPFETFTAQILTQLLLLAHIPKVAQLGVELSCSVVESSIIVKPNLRNQFASASFEPSSTISLPLLVGQCSSLLHFLLWGTCGLNCFG